MKKILFLSLLFLSSFAYAVPSPIMAARISTLSATFGSTNNFTLQGSALTTESDNDLLFASTGILTNMWMKIPVNTIAGGSSVIRTRKNNTDGNLVVTIGAGLTGAFSDDVDTDTVNGGDKFHFNVKPGGTSGSIQIMPTRILYTSNADTVSRVHRVSNTGSTMVASNTVYWNSSTTEARTNAYIPIAGTCKNLWIKVGSNTNIGIVTATARINGVNGSLTLNVPASTTGSFEDKTNSDTVAAGDKFTIQFSGGGASGTATFFGIAYDYSTTTGDSIITGPATSVSMTSTTRLPFILGPRDITTESLVRTAVGFDCTIKGIYVYMDKNPWTLTSTQTIRVDGTNSLTRALVPASTPGWSMDTSNFTVLKATSEINYQFVRGSAVDNVLDTFVTWFHVDVSAPTGRTRRFFVID